MIVSGMLWATTLCASSAYTPPNLHKVLTGENFSTISRRYGVGYQSLMDANPELVPEKIRPGTVILIPGRVEETRQAQRQTPGKYRVQNGDTDWSIAKRHGLTASALRGMNPGTDWLRLQIGHELAVPVKAQAEKPTMTVASNTAVPVVKPGGVYSVQSGDNDWTIARKFGITPKQLRLLNLGTEWESLKIGTKLNVPGSKSVRVPKITTKRAKVVRDNVIVRSGARQDAARIGMVDVGRIAEVADRIGEWYKLKFSGGTVGWVRGDMLSPVSASLVASAVGSYSAPPIRRAIERRTATVASPRSESQRVATTTTRPRATTPTRRTSSSGSGYLAAMSDAVSGSLMDTAKNQLGVRYKWGGTSRSGFDCSGFVGYVYSKHGKQLPRTSAAQSRVGSGVSKSDLKKGDLVFFNTRGGSRVSHVGIYMGNGQFIHASSGGGRVRVSNLSESYYSKRFAGARRVTGAKETASKDNKKSEDRPVIKDTVDEQVKTDSKSEPPKAEAPVEKPKAKPGEDTTGR